MIHQLIQDRYYILKLLGTGGFGETYLAKDIGRASNPLCIIKYLKPASTTAAFLKKLRQLFLRQAEILGRLGHHEQMPALVSYFEQDGGFFIVHDYAEGHTLDQEFQTDQRWSESQATELLKNVLEILSFAHSQGVIHGDVKPENLVRRYRDNRIVLVDFGTVKQEQTQFTTPDGDVHVSIAVSTPGYAAAADGTVIPDYGRDVQSVGYLGIRALTGVSIEALPRDQETGEIIWSSLALANFELEAFISRLAHPLPEERFSNASEALRALLHLTDFYAPVSVAALAANTANNVALLESPPVLLTTTVDIPPATSVHGGLLTDSELANLDAWLPGETAEEQTSTRDSAQPTLSPLTGLQKILIFGGTILALMAGIMGLVGGLGFVTPPSQWQTVLDQAHQRRGTGAFDDCLKLAQQIPSTDKLYGQAQSLIIQCRLDPAKALDEDGQRPQAMALLATIPQADPAYTAAQELLGLWSDALLSQANQAYQSGNLDQAQALIQAIPPTSPSHSIAQDALASWRAEFAANQTTLAQARQAFDQQRWPEAIALAQQVRLNGQPVPEDSDYYRQNIAPLIQNAQTRQATAPETNPVTPDGAATSPGLDSNSPPPEATPEVTASSSPEVETLNNPNLASPTPTASPEAIGNIEAAVAQ
ncbi:serine/threonine-protein kinase [Synechococcus sp. PCC 6312]|uniref:serine/threonine-protein kinase n=1 Tax=Synechococcus sp. (strain ATCC 27167 / PCC 6312) TaxID=195253 RepID=UPI00029EDF82|nr:serine/threonine-protein kinase [Synechococcus sp. PCC 6312]AFY62710.1 serine/threonine protein kinase [Synechococcus sp. PCC 6312]